MRKAAQKMLPPVFLLGIFICFSSLLWLAIYAGTNRADALALGAIVLLCALAQVAAWLGGRVFKTSKLWPAACMLASAPATLWCAYIGPAALYGSAIDLLDFTGLDAKPPFYYFAVPVLVAGAVVCAAWAVVGLLFLASDITDLLAGQKAAQVRHRLRRFAAGQPGARKEKDDAAQAQGAADQGAVSDTAAMDEPAPETVCEPSAETARPAPSDDESTDTGGDKADDNTKGDEADDTEEKRTGDE